jgi:1,4-alpha-glucan branching enzyme
VRDHLARFHWLADAVEHGTIDVEHLAALEAMDNIFPDLDFRIYA